MQEQKVESLNNCISELQQRAYAQRLKLGDTHHGYVESRREQVQLQEELFIKEKALRDTQIRSMHEMGEMKRAQELRLTNSLYRSWEKVTKPYRGSLHKFKNYKKGYHKYLIEEFINLRHQVLQVRFAEIISLDAGLRMDGIPTLDLWNWVIEVFHYSQHQTNKTQGFMGTSETCCITPRRASAPRIKPKLQPRTTVLICVTLTMCLRMRNFLSPMLCCTCLRTTKPWLKWSSKAEVQQWDKYPEPTELLLIGCLTELIWYSWDSNQVHWHQTPDCRHIDQRKFHTWWMEQSSPFVQHQPFQRSLLCQEFQLDELHQKDGEKDARTKRKKTGLWRNPGQRRRTWLVSVSTSSSSVNSPIASRSPGILKAPSRQVGFSGRPGVSENQNPTPDAASSSQGWQRDALLDISTGRHVAADKDQKYLNHQDKNRHRGTCSTWIPRISRKYSNSIRFRRFGTRKSNLATSFPYITTSCWSHGESLLDHKKDLWSETDGWLEGSRWKVDQRSGGDQRFVHDWLEPAYV